MRNKKEIHDNVINNNEIIFNNIEKERDIQALSRIIRIVMEKDNLSYSAIISQLNKINIQYSVDKSEEIYIPSSIFKHRSLGILESICIFLKDEFKLSYHEIAVLLNRDERAIWKTYHDGKKKFKGKLEEDDNSLRIPIKIFANRNFGLLENLTKYLKEKCRLKNRDIARILNRDSRTTWTSYNRTIKNINLKQN